MDVSRKIYKTIQFRPEDVEEIIALSNELSNELKIKLSQSATVMYAVRQLKKNKKG
jgi:hypothetical protein